MATINIHKENNKVVNAKLEYFLDDNRKSDATYNIVTNNNDKNLVLDKNGSADTICISNFSEPFENELFHTIHGVINDDNIATPIGEVRSIKDNEFADKRFIKKYDICTIPDIYNMYLNCPSFITPKDIIMYDFFRVPNFGGNNNDIKYDSRFLPFKISVSKESKTIFISTTPNTYYVYTYEDITTEDEERKLKITDIINPNEFELEVIIKNKVVDLRIDYNNKNFCTSLLGDINRSIMGHIAKIHTSYNYKLYKDMPNAKNDYYEELIEKYRIYNIIKFIKWIWNIDSIDSIEKLFPILLYRADKELKSVMKELKNLPQYKGI